MMETQRDRKVLAAVCPNQMGRRRRRAAVSIPACLYKQDGCDLVLNILFCLQPKVLGPRSSSPLRLGLPCVLKQGELRPSHPFEGVSCVRRFCVTYRHVVRLTAFSTIAWDDLEDSVRRESHSLGAQVRKTPIEILTKKRCVTFKMACEIHLCIL